MRQFQPYALTVAGRLAEIADGYVLVDDTALCANPKDGTTYKVYADDIRIKRCIQFLSLKTGDTVSIEYNGTISKANEVSGAYSMEAGTLVDGDLLIPE